MSEAFTTFGWSTRLSHLRGQQPGRRGRVAGVAADGAVDARGDQHHGVEGAGPLARAAAEVEDARREQLRAGGGAVDGFHLADVAEAVLADHGDADRRGLAAARLGDGLLQVCQAASRSCASRLT